MTTESAAKQMRF